MWMDELGMPVFLELLELFPRCGDIGFGQTRVVYEVQVHVSKSQLFRIRSVSIRVMKSENTGCGTHVLEAVANGGGHV